MKIEIDISEGLFQKIKVASKNLNLSPKKFIVRAIRKSARANQERQKSGEEITASLNAFFEKYPDANVGWWEDRGWDDCQPQISKDRSNNDIPKETAIPDGVKLN